MKKKKPYAGRGYIIKNFRSSRAVYQYIRSLTAGLPLTGEREDELRRKYHRFISHIYAGMNNRASINKVKQLEDRGKYVPMYSRLIEKHFGRDFDIQLLIDNKIIEMLHFDVFSRKSRRFRIHDDIYGKLIEIEAEAVDQQWRSLGEKKVPKSYDTVNIVTGRKDDRPQRSKFEVKGLASSVTNVPQLIKDSINAISPCPFNPKFIGEWVKALQEKYLWEAQCFEEVKSNEPKSREEYEEAERNLQVARGRYLNDLTAQRTIINQQPKAITTKDEKGGRSLLEYMAAYTIQVSGRISERNGGFQSATQMFKQKFVKHVPDIFNYDLKNSQANILIKELKHCKIDSSWMEGYMNNPNRKEELAEQIGIPVDIFKQCFYSMIMGADIEGKRGAVHLALEDHFDGDKKATKKAVKAFGKKVRKLSKATEKWRNYLYEEVDGRYHYQHAEKIFWQNACEMKFKDYGRRRLEDGSYELIETKELGEDRTITMGSEKDKCKRRIAAFILQGQEACFIHHLTVLCRDGKIPVYKNEHDGIITGKKISKEIIKEAGIRSGLDKPILNIKRLCTKQKEAQMNRYVKITKPDRKAHD